MKLGIEINNNKKAVNNDCFFIMCFNTYLDKRLKICINWSVILPIKYSPK